MRVLLFGVPGTSIVLKKGSPGTRRLTYTAGKVLPEHREAITAVVKKRETSMSTGIGFGIGIPHASTDLIPEVIAAFGRSRTGVSFDSLDNQPVHLVTLFLVPAGQFQRHLHTLAGIAKVLRRDDFLKSISNASDAEAMIKLIRDFSEGLR
jgi:mannitol/fructose-specific phosphotransferase system IIA component (Ntr-type)